jgi:photoactive yellow protein
MTSLPDFETPRLSEAVERLSPAEIEVLPFGVIRVDSQNIVCLHNEIEEREAGFALRPSLGKPFSFDVAPCMSWPHFEHRIAEARAAGSLDIRFNYVDDFEDRNRELTVRVQSAGDGGLWIFLKHAN